LPPELSNRVHHEIFSPQWRDRVKKLLVWVKEETFTDPVAAQLADLITVKAHEITVLLQKAEQLSSAVQAQNLEFVLCHSDIHAGNLLIESQGSVYIVDWDHPVLAPKERDLMFVGGGIGSHWYTPKEQGLFYAGYGRTEINLAALAYYRFERIIKDIAEWSEQVWLTGEGGKDRARALQGFVRWFSPHDVVEMAYRADGSLPLI
jgi:spectinomycin phosphotransferase